jgi:hypothetical protein
MTNQIDAFLEGALKHEKVRSLFDRLLANLFELLTPYLIGVTVAWGLLFVGIVAILYLLLRKGGV